MHTRRSLMLTRDWDITLDGVGRIALVGQSSRRDDPAAAGDAATAQNVANEVRLFTNDAYFVQDRGIPHFIVELGHRVNNAVLRSYLRRAALLVPDVKEVLSVNIISFDPKTRTLTGDIQFTTREGASNGAIRTYF